MNILSLIGLSLLYVGAVLFINGLTLLGKVDREEVVFINLFVGIISFLVAFNLVFGAANSPLTIRAGTFTFLFSCTYLWVSFNHYRNAEDQRGLGWYCLFVAITAVPITISAFIDAKSIWETWFAVCWAMWVVLWFTYFINIISLKISRENVGWLTLVTGVFSAWIPGYMLLYGYIS